MNRDELRSMLLVAFGEASMCWSETPSGVFDADKAIEIADLLVARIPLQRPPDPNHLCARCAGPSASTPQTITAQDSTGDDRF